MYHCLRENWLINHASPSWNVAVVPSPSLYSYEQPILMRKKQGFYNTSSVEALCKMCTLFHVCEKGYVWPLPCHTVMLPLSALSFQGSRWNCRGCGTTRNSGATGKFLEWQVFLKFVFRPFQSCKCLPTNLSGTLWTHVSLRFLL